MYSLRDLYAADVGRKIAVGHELYEAVGALLEPNGPEMQSLAKILVLAENLRQVMGRMRIFDLCRVCGGQPRGGCCSAEMANETDAVLLLMNLLAGQRVAAQRADGFECCLLGAAGCSLLFKPMFCLNYNCVKIKAGADSAEMQQLERAAGKLLQEQYILEQLVLGYLKKAHLLG